MKFQFAAMLTLAASQNINKISFSVCFLLFWVVLHAQNGAGAIKRVEIPNSEI